jgi:sirohydrochlorin ferrochelatase
MLKILSPEGPSPATSTRLAPLAQDWSGVRIGVLENRKPNARLLLTTLAERLAARTGARVTVITEKANAAVAGEPAVLERLRREVDVVLTGSGD